MPSKKTATPEVVQAPKSLVPSVDHLARMEAAWKRAHKIAATRETRYKAALKASLETLDGMMIPSAPNAAAALVGENYVMTIGERAMVSTVKDNKATLLALERIQKGLGYGLLKFGITDLRDALNGVQFGQLVDEQQIGARRVTYKPRS